MTNFDFLKSEPQFSTFADVAISAEKILHIDLAASILNCRRAMEFAVKWMYSVDKELIMPYQDKLASLMGTEEFHDIVGRDIWKRMEYIRKMGNNAAHSGKKLSKEQAQLCLENLFIFMDWIACCYAREYEERVYDPDLLKKQTEYAFTAEKELDFEKLLKENRLLKEVLTARRSEKQPQYVPKPLELSEYSTRKMYIDAMLQEAGWEKGKNWLNEVVIQGMPNHSGKGRADYVLYGDDGKPLAIVEAKRTCVDVAQGRQQAKMYADQMEIQYGRRPIIFLTNGFDTRICDDAHYPERKVAAIYSKRDLEKLFNLYRMRISLNHVSVDKNIAGRYYQEGAVKAVCDSFDEKKRRKALLVMATGSGKTRTVIALTDVLLQHGWIKNILFLADRNSLVTQAKRSFVNLMPDLSVVNLCEDKDNYQAHCVFSTYQTMMNCIDEVRDEDGKLFTSGHFDLIICDEAHRSIYNRYRDIFTYFDALLVGLTATPKDEVEKNTYEMFELENRVPTYGYELSQAVKDGYLVDFLLVESKLKFLEQGIVYDELSEAEKEVYERTFVEENGCLPESISASALNDWIYNEDTILKVLRTVIKNGLQIQFGEKIGKTIIFARKHDHAEKILEIFNREYPYLSGYAEVIDNQTKNVQYAIDRFSDPDKLPQIAISVDMLDTGIDVPEILNLVFFKKVMSKAKFWQMIGRGTRLCAGLMDGEDKSKFYIFDFCGNFEFFRMNKGKASANMIALQGAIFHLKSQLAFKLQQLEYQTKELVEFRKYLVADMVYKVQELKEKRGDCFDVRQHLKYVEMYSQEEGYQALTFEDTLLIRDELAPLIIANEGDVKAMRFDALIYGIELAMLLEQKHVRGRNDLMKKARSVANVANIPEIMAQSELLNRILHTDYVERASISDFENIRENLRGLMKYVPVPERRYDTDFQDDLLSVEWKEAELDADELKDYRAKAEYYIRKHQDNEVIAKLKSNVPLQVSDMDVLEKILWSEVGTKQDYEAEYGQKPLGEFVREIVGLDMNAAKEAFAEYQSVTNMDSRQIYFVNQIIEYIVHNGMMKDLSVLQESPFTDRGSIVEIFTDLNVWMGIKAVIDQINANALAA